MDQVVQTAQIALDSINQSMMTDNVDPHTRTQIIEFAILNRRSLRLHLTPQQQQMLDQIPFAPATEHGVPLHSVNAQAWARDDFSDGSMRYLRKIVALQQMSYAMLFTACHTDPASEHQKASALQFYGVAKPPMGLTDTFIEQQQPIPNDLKAVASYSLSKLPRPLEKAHLTNAELAGINAVDVERIMATMV